MRRYCPKSCLAKGGKPAEKMIELGCPGSEAKLAELKQEDAAEKKQLRGTQSPKAKKK